MEVVPEVARRGKHLEIPAKEKTTLEEELESCSLCCVVLAQKDIV